MNSCIVSVVYVARGRWGGGGGNGGGGERGGGGFRK